MPLGSDTDARADRGGAAPTGDIGLVWFLLGVIACTLIAFGVRLYKIDAGSFWNDELYTVTTAADFHGKNLSKLFGYVPARVGLELQAYDHSYSHFHVSVYTFETEILAGDPRALDHSELQWVEIDRLAEYPMGKVDRAIAERLAGADYSA